MTSEEITMGRIITLAKRYTVFGMKAFVLDSREIKASLKNKNKLRSGVTGKISIDDTSIYILGKIERRILIDVRVHNEEKTEIKIATKSAISGDIIESIYDVNTLSQGKFSKCEMCLPIKDSVILVEKLELLGSKSDNSNGENEILIHPASYIFTNPIAGGEVAQFNVEYIGLSLKNSMRYGTFNRLRRHKKRRCIEYDADPRMSCFAFVVELGVVNDGVLARTYRQTEQPLRDAATKIYEAALINYFKPIHNKKNVNNFSTNEISRAFEEIGTPLLSIELNMENFNAKFFSLSAPRLCSPCFPVHCQEGPFLTDSEYFRNFEPD